MRQLSYVTSVEWRRESTSLESQLTVELPSYLLSKEARVLSLGRPFSIPALFVTLSTAPIPLSLRILLGCGGDLWRWIINLRQVVTLQLLEVALNNTHPTDILHISVSE